MNGMGGPRPGGPEGDGNFDPQNMPEGKPDFDPQNRPQGDGNFDPQNRPEGFPGNPPDMDNGTKPEPPRTAGET